MWLIYFIEENTTELLKLAYEAINGLDDTSVQWCKPAKIMKKYKSYDRSCSFIFSFFEGEAFHYLKNLNMNIFGPQLLLDYLRSDDCLPKLDFPLFSTALKGVVVCFTAISENREELSEKVRMMHGTVTKDLILGVNVLVSSKIGTKKFRVAASSGIITVLESWVNELWVLSSNSDPINGIDENLIDQYRVPIFYKLMICLSGFSYAEREEMERTITKNGGEYYADLTVGKCTHLVSKQATGKKYNYAERWKIQIVSWKWLTDSINKGYALDEDDYRLSRETRIAGSTPNSGKQLSFESRGHEVSTITVGHIEETYLDDDDEMKGIWHDCVISFLGCPQEVIDKWALIIDTNGGRACRFLAESITEPVTHVAVGNSPHTLPANRDDGVDYVRFDWLSACLDEKQLVPVTEFVIVDADVATIIGVQPVIELPANQSWQLLDQYFNSEPPIEDTQMTVSQLGLFSRWRLVLADNLSQQQRDLVTSLAADNDASVVTEAAVATHLVAPEVVSQPIKLANIPLQQHITLFYLQSCVQRNSVLSTDDDFMFRPVFGTQVLAGTVLAFSGYAAEERNLLKVICVALGAVVQEQMVRRPIASKGLRATTHLIIGKRDNKKYPSSKAWGIPAVNKHWIGACARNGTLADTHEFPMQQQQASTDVDMSVMSGDTASSLNETHMTVIPETAPKAAPTNKHIQIRNNNNANISLGDLSSPIMRTYNVADGQPRKLNLDLEMLRTPEHFQKPVYGQRQQQNADHSFSTPEMTRVLKSRIALLDLQSHGRHNKYLDTSLSDMVSKPASLPLHSVVVYISKSVQSELMDQKAIVEKLGGKCSWVYDRKSVSHVICSLTESDNEPISDRNREELAKALDDGKILVNSDWLKDCSAELARVDEALYMVNLNESMADSHSRSSSLGSRKRKAEEELIDLENRYETRPGMKLKVSTDSDQSAVHVAWNYKDQVQSMELTQCSGEETQLEDTVDHDRVIMLCGIDKEICETYAGTVDRLGGASISASKEFCPSVTHLICDKPGRNAKYLSAIAAGKWVLHPSYIEASATANKWLDESPFEWGGPRNEEFVTGKSFNSHELALCDAAKRMREFGGGAFRDWRVSLIDKAEKVEKFSTIITSGGGTVIPSSPLPAVSDVTHLLINKNQCSGLPDLSNYFCYKIDFLSYFLSARNDSENKKYIKAFSISAKEMASITGIVDTKVRSSRRTSKRL